MPTRTTCLLLSFLFVAAAGCSNDSNPSTLCDTAAAPESCGQTCTLDTECGSDAHCGAAGECTIECATGTGDCGESAYCDSRGRCQSALIPNPECPRIAVTADEVMPTVQLLIDQSGSMNDPFGDGLTRWQAVREALVREESVDKPAGVVTALASKVRFGATLYSSIGGYGEAGDKICPILIEEAPALGNTAAIRALMAANEPRRDTPTAESVTAVANALKPLDPQNPEPLIILLATDGNPDSCEDPDSNNKDASEMAVQQAYAKGIKTFVLSVGTDTTQEHLQRLANAGVGRPLDTGEAPYFVANDPGQLATAFRQIIGTVRSCTFDLENQVSDPTGSLVELNGTPLEYGTDWTLPNPSTLELVGAACQSYLDQPTAKLDAEFACGTVIL